MLYVNYPKCTTCIKARKFLEQVGAQFEERNIKTENPTYEELKEWHSKSGLPLRRFFNTSGMLYRSLGLKDKLDDMSEEDMLELLASDGMLVKRPILVTQDKTLVGFRQSEWEEILK